MNPGGSIWFHLYTLRKKKYDMPATPMYRFSGIFLYWVGKILPITFDWVGKVHVWVGFSHPCPPLDRANVLLY